MFTRDGRYLHEVSKTTWATSTPSHHQHGTYGGVCIDQSGRYMATRSEKGRCIIQVFDATRRWIFDIDSFEDRLRRPSGIGVDNNGYIYVADLGNDCIKKFPYV